MAGWRLPTIDARRRISVQKASDGGVAVVTEVSDQTFAAFIQSEQPVLIDFWATWCAPCRMLSPVVVELAEELQGKLVVGKLNVDDNPRTAAQYGIMSIPTLLIFQKGEVVRQVVGFLPKRQLQAKLADLLPAN